MAVKVIPVVAAKVPSTQTNFPVYIKPSAMTGWGSLSLAEARSTRWYSDAGLTTELARDVVSADEIHVKVPSLTTTTTLYCSYNGTDADYAVTDTYGRNAVWSDYLIVAHQTDTENATGGTDFTNSDVALNTASGFSNSSGEYDGNDYLTIAHSTTYEPSTITVQTWVRVTSQSINTYPHLVNKMNAFSGVGYRINLAYDGGIDHKATFTIYSGSNYRSANTTSSYTVGTGTWYKIDGTYDGSNVRVYFNGVNEGTIAHSGTIQYGTSTAVGLGVNMTGTQFFLTGGLDESRVRSGALSGNWLTTEYNNQSDVGTFWGTVTDSVTTVPSRLMMMGVG